MAFGTAQTSLANIANYFANYGGLGNPVTIPLNFGQGQYFTGPGNGALQANNIAGNTVLVTSGTPTVIDITAVVQPDGTATAFTDLLVVGFFNHGDPGAGETLTIGGGTNPVVSIFSANLILLGATPFLVSCPNATGYAINTSTAKAFTLNVASGTNVKVDYLLIGH